MVLYIDQDHQGNKCINETLIRIYYILYIFKMINFVYWHAQGKNKQNWKPQK